MVRTARRSDMLSWGRVDRVPHHVAALSHATEASDALAALGAEGRVLPVGLRRSYGDTVINASETLLDLSGADRLLALDETEGLLTCEGGASLDRILGTIVPRGWYLPTSPGTRFVTIGGAIANDVHGKNHHHAGTFGSAVTALTLARSDGSPQRLLPGDPLFGATVGGLGLTGAIVDATFRLAPIRSAYLNVTRTPYASVSEFFELAREATGEHTVSWIDCAHGGASLGRGIFQSADWCEDGELAPHERRGGPRLPVDAPGWALNGLTVRAFNALYHRLQARGAGRSRVHYAPFFYPLDALREWNRLYGRRGFYQYQCVVPPAAAETAVTEMLRIITRSGAASFLAVLKTFGPRPSPGVLSFPFEGATLALDFANRGPATLELMARLDGVVREAQGRLYPAKDGRMPAAMFRQGFPGWERVEAARDPAIISDFWKRVAHR